MLDPLKNEMVHLKGLSINKMYYHIMCKVYYKYIIKIGRVTFGNSENDV